MKVNLTWWPNFVSVNEYQNIVETNIAPLFRVKIVLISENIIPVHRPIQQEFSLQPFYQESSQVQSPPKKPKKLFVKKKPKPAPLSDDDSDDSVDYDNTNIIFKPRKLSKYHLMVKAGDQVLPTGEQVVSGDVKTKNLLFIYDFNTACYWNKTSMIWLTWM